MRVADIMTTEVTTLGPRATLAEAAEELRLGRIRHLPIVDKDGVLVGLITHRDMLRAQDQLDQPIERFMPTDIKTVGPETAAHEAAYVLLRYPIGCVPITDDRGVLVGIVTESDFVRIAYTKLGGRVPVDEIEHEELESERV